MGLPYFVRAHLYVGGAHIHKRALRGRAVRRTSPSPFWANQRRCLWNRSSRTELLRGERSYADGVPVQSAVSAHAGIHQFKDGRHAVIDRNCLRSVILYGKPYF